MMYRLYRGRTSWFKLRFTRTLSSVALSVVAGIGYAAAQTADTVATGRSAALMPDISIMGDLALKASSDEHDIERGRILLREVEIGYQGYVYPNLRADIFIALHRHGEGMEPEVCEGYLSLLNLHGGLALRTGRLHVDIGKVNKVHQHERPFADQPLVLTSFFGEHGFVADGAVASWLAPLPWFLQVDVGRWYVPLPQHLHDVPEDPDNGHEEEHPASHHTHGFSLADHLTTVRLWSGVSLGGALEVELGASGIRGSGPHVREHQDDVAIIGADATVKLHRKAFQRVLVQGEWYRLHRTVPIGAWEREGWYVYAGYRRSRYWEFGIRYDQSDNALPERENAGQLALIMTNTFSETARLRLQYGYNTETRVTEWWLQTVFGLGPHTHPLQ